MSDVKQFKLPDVGEGLTEGEILKWYVQPGDRVAINQTIVEIETAKAAVELPCPWEGVVRELLVDEGSTVNVGAPIISIDVAPDGAEKEPDAGLIGGPAPGGRTSVLVGYGPRSTEAKRRPRRHVPHTGPGAVPAAEPTVPGGPLGTEPVKPVRHGGLELGRITEQRESARAGQAVPAHTIHLEEQGETARMAVLAKPPIRKLAKDLGVDLRTVTPSGPGGTITRDDVQAAAAPTVPTTAAAAAPGERETRVAIKGVRKMTAQAMVASAFTAPHVTEFVQVDATRTVELVERLRRHRDFADVKISPLLIVAKAMILAVRRTPEVNASWDADRQEVVLKHYVNLGIAAATGRGLIVPNIKDADRLTLAELARALQELTATARAGKTTPADMSGGTITITNVGVFGVDAGTPIINPGEAAILCLGQVRPMPWVVDGQVVPRQVTTLGLSFDHRMVDGEQGSRFLADVAAILEDPATALLWA